ncbi:MAG: ABC transporter ATP-binding protein [Anaerorhabdus sp.]
MSQRMKKFISYYKPYKKLFFADMTCALIVSAISLVLPLLIRKITNEVLLITPVPLDQIFKIALVMVALVIIEFLCNFFITYKGHLMGVYMEKDMRNDLFQHYQKLSFSFYDEQKTGILMSRITSDLHSLSELYHHGPEDIVISIIKFIGSFVILFQINSKLTILVFSILPFMIIFAYFCNKNMRKVFRQTKKAIGNIHARVEDNLSGIRVVKSFANEDVEIHRFNNSNNDYVSSRDGSYYVMAQFHTGLGAFISLISVIVVVFGSIFISNGFIILGDLLTFLLYIGNFTDPIKKLINFTEQFQEGITGFERFMEIVEIQPDIQDDPEAIEFDDVQGNIEFNDVGFRYNEKSEYVLNHVNLKVTAGEYLALVGSSGAGKTTLCSLIPRFYEVSNGSITIDGKDIRKVAMKSLRSKIGLVQQDIYLFAGTILENIRYGKPDATEEEIVEAAKNANAHDFIMSLSEGYDTDIGQRGVKLSGGQKQRISIARVFLKNPPILIFDEATSALDNESELIVQQSLERLAKNRTTFVIAHRLSTIRNAKKIVVLSANGIEETGTHDELLAKGAHYAKLYNMQFSEK